MDKVNKFHQGISRRILVVIEVEAGIIAMLLIGIVLVYNSPAKRLSRQLDLGQKYLIVQDYEQAVVAFTRAIEIDPLNVDAYIGLAQAYEGLEEYEQARAVLEEGSESVGENAELSSCLDVVLALIENDTVDEIINMDSWQLFREPEILETEEQVLNIEEEKSEEQSEQTEEIVWTVERRDFSPIEENGDILLRIYYDLVQTDGNTEHCQEINAALKADYDAFVRQVPTIKQDNAALERV